MKASEHTYHRTNAVCNTHNTSPSRSVHTYKVAQALRCSSRYATGSLWMAPYGFGRCIASSVLDRASAAAPSPRV